MKKFISLFLVISIIMGNLNTEMVDALSDYGNEVKSLYNTLTQNNKESIDNSKNKKDESTEAKDELKNQEDESTEAKDELKNQEDESTEAKDELKNQEDESIETKDELKNKEDKLVETTDLENKEEDVEESSTSKPSTYSNQPITVIDNNKNETHYGNLASAMTSIKNLNGTVTIRFNQNYTFNGSDYDSNKIGVAFSADRLIFTAKSGVTVTVGSDLELYAENPNYQPDWDYAKYITFENIKFNFTGEYGIYANGTWLHMGKGIEMVGSYPKLFAGSKRSGNYVDKFIKMYVLSGSYSQIGIQGIGRQIHGHVYLYVADSYVKELLRCNDSIHKSSIDVRIFDSTIDVINNENTHYSISVHAAGNTTIKTLKNVTELGAGTAYNDKNWNQIKVPGHVTITEKVEGNISNTTLFDNSILEIGENVPTINTSYLSVEQNTTIRVPPNRDKDNVPIISQQGVGAYNTHLNLELSTNNIKKRDFYLVKILRWNAELKSKIIIDEKEHIYMENEPDPSNNTIMYLKGRAKEKGPLIYDISSDKFLYHDFIDNKVKEAEWIKDKNLNLNDVLEYDNLAKSKEDHYALSPDEITLKIIGNGSNRTFKFRNSRYNDRPISIEFENLNATDCEFSFENINSIKVTGTNSIVRSSSKQEIPLTYSFSGSNRDALTLTTENSSFVVYDQGDSNRYTVRQDNIVNIGNSGNTSIVNMSFEEDISSPINYKLVPVNSGNTKKFSTKIGYNELTLLLPGDDKDYLLKEDNGSTSDVPYYYQSAKYSGGNQNCGKVGTKFTLACNSKKDYYNVNNKQRVQVIATQNNNEYYYLANNLIDAMNPYVAHTGGTHEVIFLGNYNITSNDVDAIKSHNKNTNGITFKTKVDDWTYLLNVDVDIELKIDKESNQFTVAFDNIKFNYKSDGKWIYANGRRLTFGSDVEMVGQYYPSVSAGQNIGQAGKHSVNYANVTINSGTYQNVTGDRYNTLQNANVTINDGTFKGEVSGVRDDSQVKNQINNATLTITGGIFDSKVYGVSPGSTANGSLSMTINGGTFNQEVIGVAGAVNDYDATLTINNGTFNSKVSGSSSGSNVNRSLNMTIKDGTFKGEVIGVSGTVGNDATLTINNGTFESKVSGSGIGSAVNGTLNMTIDTGTFKNKVIVVNGGTINNATLTVNNGTFENVIHGVSTDTTRAKFTLKSLFNGDLLKNSARTTVNGNLNMIIRDGTFRNQVHGANSASNSVNVTLQILGGNFNHNIVGTQVSGSTLVMTVNGGTFNAEVVGQYSGKANSVTLNIANGTFKGNVRGADDSNETTLNVSGGTFNVHIYGDRSTSSDNVKININGNISVPIVGNYDELVVGEKSRCELTITDKIEATNKQNNNLTIKNGSEVKLTGSNQSIVNNLTIDGTGNILTLKMNDDTAPLVINSAYINNNQKLILKPLNGAKANDKRLIRFASRNLDVSKFIFSESDYYIREINQSDGDVIKIYAKTLPNKLQFRLDLSSSTLKYSVDGTNFNDVWWYTPSLTSQNINFNSSNLFEYKGMSLFKDINSIANGNKVFELINNGSNKVISLDLGAGTNFDFKLNNSNLTNSRLDLKNLRNLILNGGNSISGNPSDSNPAFSYQISGAVETANNSNLIVYTNSGNEGIKAVNQSGYGVKFIFEEVISAGTNLKLKEQNSNNEVQLVIPANSQKVSLLLPQSFASKTYNLIDNTNQSAVYYFGNVVGSTFGYDISIDNKGKTYNNVNNKPFIGISKNGNFAYSGKSMSEVITYINQDASKQSTDYTLTFMNDYELSNSDLSSWKSWNENVKSMTLTTKYTPLNKNYLLTIDGDLTLARANYKTTFRNIKLKFKNSNPWIYANGQYLVMESGIENLSNDKLSISGGSDNIITSVPSAKIEVFQGDYKSIVGSTSPVTGNVNVTVRGTSTVDSVTGSTSSVGGSLDILYGDRANITNSIVGSKQSGNNTTITINQHLDINEIVGFDNLVIGNTQQVNLTNINKLDKGTSNGNLTLKRASKISFNSNSQTAKLNDIVLDGSDNTFVLPSNRSENSVPIELDGDIITNNNNKLKIEFDQSNNTNISESYLIKFKTKANADVENKYILPDGYYVRDKEDIWSGYAILYPQTAFDLEYNFTDRKLYKIENGQKSEAWWYTGVSNNVTLTSDQLYKYKGYDLFKDPQNNVERNITLKGSNSNQAFGINNKNSNLNHFNVILDNINLTSSRIAVLGIKSLKLIGENTINSIDQTSAIFVSEFQSGITGNNVLFDSNNSYLKVFAKSANPFRFVDKASGDCMDFKFFDPFISDSKVRLNDNAGHELKFDVPNGTQRLGILLKNSNSNKPYNLYHGESGNTGSSVYVCGNTQDTFKECFEISSNNIVSYNYVRRAKPVNIFNGKVSDQMSFSLDTTSSGLDGIKPDNWEQYFNATDMTIENNNSRIVKDQFTDEHGVTHYFGETNADLELGYMGVSPSENSSNDIKLVSKDEIDSNITNSSDGVKLALKFLDESCKANLDGSSCKVHSDGSCQVPIDETESTTGPLKEWTIPSNSSKTLKIIPDFNTNNIFFNVNMNSPAMLNSSHKFTFRFGLQKP